MTESEWLTSIDPIPMLKLVDRKYDQRKLRLFAVACCRQIWDLLTDERNRAAIDVVERWRTSSKKPE